MTWIGLILVFLSGIANGFSDRISFHYDTVPEFLSPNFWNPLISYKNKYKDDDPKKGERFFGSTTFLVFLTDGWHLTQFLNNKLLVFGVIVVMLAGFDVVNILSIFAMYHIGFQIIYK